MDSGEYESGSLGWEGDIRLRRDLVELLPPGQSLCYPRLGSSVSAFRRFTVLEGRHCVMLLWLLDFGSLVTTLGGKSGFGLLGLAFRRSVFPGFHGPLQALFAGWIPVSTVTEFHCGVPRYPHYASASLVVEWFVFLACYGLEDPGGVVGSL